MSKLKGRSLKSKLDRSRERKDKPSTRVQSWKKWYSTKQWRELRRAVFKRDGLVCQATGALCVGKYPAHNSPVADHIRPHRGRRDLFFDIENVQTVTKAYHDSEKQKLEATGQLDPD